ncbi:hypothetical protein [Pontibacter sp. G13]|uniref:hypothetical protein n=1 Tax=Pontibacter sp. G13 TaxID=3074898 RepID=UPI00288925F1|nr:hypothetical protein [Pontibacter sp. G13]WNJ20539.1 hypothetical protein RJD25_08655 [Pontibacter sp. G13]
MLHDYHLSDSIKRAEIADSFRKKPSSLFWALVSIWMVGGLLPIGAWAFEWIGDPGDGMIRLWAGISLLGLGWILGRQIRQSFQIQSAFDIWKQAQRAFLTSPKHKQEQAAQLLAAEIDQVEAKQIELEQQMASGQGYLAQLDEMLADPLLLDAGRERHQARRQELAETLDAKHRLHTFYERTHESLCIRLKNLTYELKASEIDDYLSASAKTHLHQSGGLEETQLTMTFLHEMRELEQEIPDLGEHALSRASRELLIERLSELEAQ